MERINCVHRACAGCCLVNNFVTHMDPDNSLDKGEEVTLMMYCSLLFSSFLRWMLVAATCSVFLLCLLIIVRTHRITTSDRFRRIQAGIYTRSTLYAFSPTHHTTWHPLRSPLADQTSTDTFLLSSKAFHMSFFNPFRRAQAQEASGAITIQAKWGRER